MKTDKRKPSQ